METYPHTSLLWHFGNVKLWSSIGKIIKPHLLTFPRLVSTVDSKHQKVKSVKVTLKRLFDITL